MTCLGVLDRGERGDDTETGLKERGGIEMSTTVLSYTRCTLSSLDLLTVPSVSVEIRGGMQIEHVASGICLLLNGIVYGV